MQNHPKEQLQARSNQPEVKATWDDYLSKRVTSRRIDNGVQFLKRAYRYI